MTTFSKFTSLFSHEALDCSLEEVYHRTIDPDCRIAEWTRMSRHHRSMGNKAVADMYKAKCGVYVCSALCNGGHAQQNILEMTRLMVGDIDHIDGDMSRLLDIIRQDPHTMLAHITNSEHGIRIITHWTLKDMTGMEVNGDMFRWNPDVPHSVFINDMNRLHAMAYARINEYYHQIVGHWFDPQTKDINRCAFFCHDPGCYLNIDAAPFLITTQEVEATRLAEEEQRLMAMAKSKPSTAFRPTNEQGDVYSLVESWVSRHVLYVEGSYNNYVMRCLYLLHDFDVSHDEAMAWALKRFGDYPEGKLRAIVKSCYNSVSRRHLSMRQ